MSKYINRTMKPLTDAEFSSSLRAFARAARRNGLELRAVHIPEIASWPTDYLQ